MKCSEGCDNASSGAFSAEEQNVFQYMDDRLGFVDTFSDEAYVMDDFGNAVWVPFSMQHPEYFQNPDTTDPRDTR